ncbi:hypothetical protein G9H72_19040 [Motilibacter sp. K478]|nr:hypothetical protein [Motilibacter aurantiacus]
MEGLQSVPDVGVAAWIAPRLGGPVGSVGFVVPRGYPAYARVLHPVQAGQGVGVTTWARVCAATGRVPHALMQWLRITRPVRGAGLPTAGDGRWSEVDVEPGNLEQGSLRALLDVLAASTRGQDCLHALWDGYGWAAMIGRSTAPAPVLDEALAAPRVTLPGRDYLLFGGRLHAALHIGDQVTDGWVLPQSPNLLWPADRSWCLATEVDFDSTLVGGQPGLVAAVLAHPGLEAWPVTEDDDLSALGDRVNS